MKYFISLYSIIMILLIGCNEKSIQPDHGKDFQISEVVFCSANFDSNSTNIYMMNTDGEIIKNITSAAFGEKFVATAISPSSDSLLFYQVAPGYGLDIAGDIYIYNIKEEVITGPITIGNPGNFSPDGKYFVFDRHTYGDDGGFDSIYLYNLENNTSKKLTKDGFHCFDAQISPDGKNICFQSAKFLERDSISTWQLHLMSINGENIIDLTEYKDGYYSANGIFAPDGKSIICDLRINASLPTSIVQIDLNTKQLKYITNVEDNVSLKWTSFFDPSISTESNRIYFYIKEYDYEIKKVRMELWGINLDGTDLKYLYKNNNYWVSHPIAGTVSYHINN